MLKLRSCENVQVLDDRSSTVESDSFRMVIVSEGSSHSSEASPSEGSRQRRAFRGEPSAVSLQRGAFSGGPAEESLQWGAFRGER